MCGSEVSKEESQGGLRTRPQERTGAHVVCARTCSLCVCVCVSVRLCCVCRVCGLCCVRPAWSVLAREGDCEIMRHNVGCGRVLGRVYRGADCSDDAA